MSENPLLNLRTSIDAIDRQLLQLFNQRAALAHQVGEIKRLEDKDCIFYRPEREAQIIREAVANNQGPLADETIGVLFREVMSACRGLEQEISVVYLGPAGTYSEAALIRHFGHSPCHLACATFSEIFREVERGSAHFGVVPVENSGEGAIVQTLDLFLEYDLKICGEILLKIHHNLISNQPRLTEISRVYAHPQALAQCRNWLAEHLPHAEQIPVSSNAEAVRVVSNEQSGCAAIAGVTAAELYNIPVLKHGIEDRQDNATRFLVLGKDNVPVSGKDKSSLLVSAHNEAGALYRLLTPLQQHDVSIMRIESRPSRRESWEYVFFIDIEGHIDEPHVAAALQELATQASSMKVLGSYPVANSIS